jgi:hypothetical protein
MQAAFTALLPEDLFYFTRPFFTQETRDQKSTNADTSPAATHIRHAPPINWQLQFAL